MIDKDFELFIKNIKNNTGIDLSLYKVDQTKRRLISFYTKNGYSNFTEFYLGIKKDSFLKDEFLNFFTINVSEFFRDKAKWDFLKSKYLPVLLSERKSLKCWSAACSSGDEPYTLSMILNEMGLCNFTILATDLDLEILKSAKTGVYKSRSLRNIPKSYLNKYFKESNSSYILCNQIKDSVTFKYNNLLSDSFDENFDLIICRNVMIYFTEEAKKDLFKKFSNSLRSGGILFIGSTETMINPEFYGFEKVAYGFYKKL